MGSRFIPTCVGNTASARASSGEEAVHPHVRGEHASLEAACSAAVGSSPRAWGTRVQRVSLTERPRFIPTCVGNTEARPG